MNKRATIRDVAKAAGVSITTTSQVIKGIGNFSDATIKRVWQVVNELNYTPNPYAKKYFSGETFDMPYNRPHPVGFYHKGNTSHTSAIRYSPGVQFRRKNIFLHTDWAYNSTH